MVTTGTLQIKHRYFNVKPETTVGHKGLIGITSDTTKTGKVLTIKSKHDKRCSFSDYIVISQALQPRDNVI
jgi:hypothetical protein